MNNNLKLPKSLVVFLLGGAIFVAGMATEMGLMVVELFGLAPLGWATRPMGISMAISGIALVTIVIPAGVCAIINSSRHR
jgi:hypothetical protein